MKRIRWIALLIVGSLVLAGCGAAASSSTAKSPHKPALAGAVARQFAKDYFDFSWRTPSAQVSELEAVSTPACLTAVMAQLGSAFDKAARKYDVSHHVTSIFTPKEVIVHGAVVTVSGSTNSTVGGKSTASGSRASLALTMRKIDSVWKVASIASGSGSASSNG